MNKFWRITAVLGLAVLTANAVILLAILHRMPQPLPTLGEYKAATAQRRTQLSDQTSIVRATAAIDNDTPITVKIDEQPVEVHPVR